MTGAAPGGPEGGEAIQAAASAASAAVGLITAYAAGRRDTTRAEITGDVPPGLVLAGLEGIAAGLLQAISPADGGEGLLRTLGLRFAALAAGGDQQTDLPPAAARDRCSWWGDNPPGWCPEARGFPGAGPEVPPFCLRHLQALESWVTARAARRTAEPEAWIRWAARQAAEQEAALRAVGDLPPAFRPPAGA